MGYSFLTFKTLHYENFKNVPVNEIDSIVSNNEYENSFQKRIIKFIFRNKEIRLTNEFEEAKEKIKETVEEIFNSTVPITEEETKQLFEPEFIIEKMTLVLQEYLSEND